MQPRILFYAKPISLAYALSLLASINFSYFSLSDCSFIAVLKPSSEPLPSLKQLCHRIVEKTVQALCGHFHRDELNQLRPTKRQSWSSIKRKAPFYDAIRDLASKTSLLDYLHLAEWGVRDQGLPWRPNPEGRGRPVTYDPIKLTALLLLKDLVPGGFRGLAQRVREAGYDARLAPQESQQAKPPSFGHLRKILAQKLPEVYLTACITKLDQWCAARHTAVFGDHFRHLFGSDSTRSPTTQMEVREVAMQPRLCTKTVGYNLAVRLVTNSIYAVQVPEEGKATCDIRDLLAQLPEGAIVVQDREYDIEYDHEAANKAGLDYQTKWKTYGKRKDPTGAGIGKESKEVRPKEVPAPETGRATVRE